MDGTGKSKVLQEVLADLKIENTPTTTNIQQKFSKTREIMAFWSKISYF